MLKHQSATIDGFLVFAVTPIGIYSFIFPASAALLGMKVVSLVIMVNGTMTTITPSHGLQRNICFDLHNLRFNSKNLFFSIKTFNNQNNVFTISISKD